jgi:hypothetical protein
MRRFVAYAAVMSFAVAPVASGGDAVCATMWAVRPAHCCCRAREAQGEAALRCCLRTERSGGAALEGSPRQASSPPLVIAVAHTVVASTAAPAVDQRSDLPSARRSAPLPLPLRI